MKFSDFSSIVQLGVGLHIGTAFLQMYGEIGLQPLVRKFERIKKLWDALTDENKQKNKDVLETLEARLNIFKIELFNSYKFYTILNSIFGVILIILLCLIAIFAESETSANQCILIISLSILPAPITLFSLWVDASRRASEIEKAANSLEERILKTPS